MKSLLIFAVIITLASSESRSSFALAPWRWKCVNSQCVRTSDRVENLEAPFPTSDNLFSLDGCKSMCGEFGALFPRPRAAVLSKELTPVHLTSKAASDCCTLTGGAKSPRLEGFLQTAFKAFVANAASLHRDAVGGSPSSEAKTLKISFDVKSDVLHLDIDTMEDYELKVLTAEAEVTVNIVASTAFGARHALETLGQLLSFDPAMGQLHIVKEVKIEDAPQFKYRGLLLDTGRNYFSLESIRRIIDGMSYDRLNLLHWHLNEQQSVPFVFESVPELTKFGAYSEDELYFPSDVRGIVDYAHARGIIVLPEFDAPAHASAGWSELAKSDPHMGELVTCAQRKWADGNWTLAAEPPSGQLNPLNERVYELLERVYKDMLAAFSTPSQPNGAGMFHMGGDEINFPCWGTNKDIQNWITKKGYGPEQSDQGYLELWSQFQAKAKSKLVKANKGKKFKHDQIVWTSELSKAENIEKYLPKEDYIIQLWCTGFDYWISDLLSRGYRLLFSNSDAWYLDCGFGAWVYPGEGPDNNWCSPFKSWKTFYTNSPRDLVTNQGMVWDQVKHLVMGGEAAMWSEQVDSSAVESRIWPRLSAFAERMWSDPITGWAMAEQRILQQRHRFAQRGLRPDAIQPEFCRQHDGYCFMPQKKYEFQSGVMPDANNENFQSGTVTNSDDNTAMNRNSAPVSSNDDVSDFSSHDRGTFRAHSHETSKTLSYISLLLASLLVCLAWMNRRVLVPFCMSKIRALTTKQRPGQRFN